jgi:hypothetical protein
VMLAGEIDGEDAGHGFRSSVKGWERVHTEIAEQGEDTEQNICWPFSVPSPTSVSSVFTRFHPSISAKNTDAAG